MYQNVSGKSIENQELILRVFFLLCPPLQVLSILLVTPVYIYTCILRTRVDQSRLVGSFMSVVSIKEMQEI